MELLGIALSICQNWLARPVSKLNPLFPRVFAEKPFPLCILFRILLIWLDRIESEILLTTGMVSQVSSDSWNAP